MNDTFICFQGNLGNDVTLRQAGEATVATFRVAVTPRRYVRKDEAWVDADTQWYTVNAWRALGEHCERSLRRGDPICVQGRLQAQTWTNTAGIEVTSFEVDAVAVGHDLARGTSVFTRTPRASSGDAGSGEAGSGEAGSEGQADASVAA